MDKLHGYRSFTDSGSHSFYGTVAHIAYGEYAGNIRLKQERITIECPPFRALSVTNNVGTRQEEPTVVPLDETGQPIGARQCSNENKHRIRRHALRLAGVGTKHRNLFEMGFAMCLDHAGVCPQLNVRRLLNLVDQVFRHRAGERFAAHKNSDALCEFSEVHRGLTRRIRAAHDVDDLTLTGQSFRGAATIVNPRTLQPVYAGSVQSSPLHSGCDHQRVTRDLVSIRQLDDSVRP